jgi:hypothetical protein
LQHHTIACQMDKRLQSHMNAATGEKAAHFPALRLVHPGPVKPSKQWQRLVCFKSHTPRPEQSFGQCTSRKSNPSALYVSSLNRIWPSTHFAITKQPILISNVRFILKRQVMETSNAIRPSRIYAVNLTPFFVLKLSTNLSRAVMLAPCLYYD